MASTLVESGYKYRFYPEPEQQTLLAKTFGCCRWVYNTILAEQEARFPAGRKRLNYEQTSKLLTDLKKQPELVWLCEPSAVPLQQSARHLERGYVNLFEGRGKKPTYKSRRDEQSATYMNVAFTWDASHRRLEVAKLGRLKIVWSRPLPRNSSPSSITISKDRSGRYFVSINVKHVVEALPVNDHTDGVDLGIRALITLSDGTKVTNPRFLIQAQQRLARAQRELSKKKKGSKNREKARIKVARLHAQVADARRDHLHKLTTSLIRENQALGVERLAISNMLTCHPLAKHIADAAWGELIRQLLYKAEWYGRLVQAADRFFPSSKLCSTPGCGYKLPKLDLKVRSWQCPHCLVVHDRDTNAARNLKAFIQSCRANQGVGLGNGSHTAGRAVAACGAGVSPGGDASLSGNLRKTRPGREGTRNLGTSVRKAPITQSPV